MSSQGDTPDVPGFIALDGQQGRLEHEASGPATGEYAEETLEVLVSQGA